MQSENHDNILFNHDFINMVEIKKTQECPICYENIENPIILNCHHTFCLKCIRLLEQEHINGKIKCPLC